MELFPAIRITFTAAFTQLPQAAPTQPRAAIRPTTRDPVPLPRSVPPAAALPPLQERPSHRTRPGNDAAASIIGIVRKGHSLCCCWIQHNTLMARKHMGRVPVLPSLTSSDATLNLSRINNASIQNRQRNIKIFLTGYNSGRGTQCPYPTYSRPENFFCFLLLLQGLHLFLEL